MSENFWIVVGMSIAYVASFSGLIFAWLHYKKRKSQKKPIRDREK